MFGKEKNPHMNEKKYNNLSAILEEHMKADQEYDYFKKLYSQIKEQYLEKLKDENFNIEVEKTRLESKAGKMVGNVTLFDVNILILALSILGTGLIQAYSLIDSLNKFGVVAFTTIAFAAAIYITVFPNKKSRDLEYLSHLCLKVLDDIEKHQSKIELETNTTVEEAASTTEDHKENSQIRHLSNSNNGNWSVYVSSTSFVDIVKGTYKAVKYFKRLIQKKKAS
ncbi:hypothetical protein [Clostridium thermarum]|uniref:hypothetical protein n=1 Tax=Clostridium thermarum TaxID=1716543 RepID=UPI0013D4675A|nr:hypothetical protein [Clostridium thermarum]